MVCELASREHTDPFGRKVRISPQTIDRWIRDWRAGGSTPWCPNPRQCTPRTPAEVLELAVALRHENPDRTAGAIQRILRTQLAGDRIALRGRRSCPGFVAIGAGSSPSLLVSVAHQGSRREMRCLVAYSRTRSWITIPSPLATT